jgi:hypothetical protein
VAEVGTTENGINNRIHFTATTDIDLHKKYKWNYIIEEITMPEAKDYVALVLKIIYGGT